MALIALCVARIDELHMRQIYSGFPENNIKECAISIYVMTLGDSLFHAIECIWDAVREYEYSANSKKELIEAITKLRYALYCIDNDGDVTTLTLDDIRKLVLVRWDMETM
jgi:hypothetical protein